MKEFTRAEKCLIWLDGFVGLEYKHKREFIEEYAQEENLLELAKRYILSRVGEKEYRTVKNSFSEEYIEFLIESYQKKGISLTTCLSEDYPKNLNEINCPPLVIYYKGDLKLLDKHTFAIVGSRKSLPISLNIAERYTEDLVSAGFIPVTGIAEGVDGRVLNKTLEVGGKPVSVIAGGFNNIYPKHHAELVDKVAKNGLVLSEYPPDTVPKPYLFPVRNRIIAGVSKGVLVVSGAMRSGTLYTAEYAVDFGKDLFAVPYSIGVPSGAGCNDLIKKGAILTDSPKDIIDFYGLTVQKPIVNLSADEKTVISLLKDGGLHIEKICALLKKQVFEITPLLSVLEIKGLVIKSGNVYALTRNDLEE